MDLGSVCFEVHLGSDLSSDNLYSMHSRNINYLFTFCFMKKKITKKEFTIKIYFLCIEPWWKVLALWDFPHHRGFDINIDLKHYRMIDDKWCIRYNWTDSKQNLSILVPFAFNMFVCVSLKTGFKPHIIECRSSLFSGLWDVHVLHWVCNFN